MNSELKIKELSIKLNDLISKTNKLLEITNSVEIKERLDLEIQKLNNRIDLKVAFVGQYSSGKSTIISAMTGNKQIKIDANVATDVVCDYKWNNILLVDTPGILAGKLESHDSRTKEALRDSDLVVYVITSQLFDDLIFDNFIDLAYNQALKDKILIAVNKMSMEEGEFEELQENYFQSISKSFTDRGYEFDIPIVFIDAADYIEGKEDSDEEFIQLSNFNLFINTLNSFVEQRGIIKKQFDTPIRILKDSVSDIALSVIDPNLEVILSQGISKVQKSKKSCEFEIRSIVNRLIDNIKTEGYSVGNGIGVDSEEEFIRKQEDYQKYCEEEIIKVNQEIEVLIDDELVMLSGDLKEFVNKDSVLAFENILDIKLNENLNLENNVFKGYQKQKELISFFKEGSSQLAKMAIKDASLNGLKAVSGSDLHGVVYNTGKFFGYKFKPWGATKMAGNIGKGAAVAGPLLSALSMFLEYRENKKEEERIQQLQVVKNKYYNSIREYVDNIKSQIMEFSNDFIKSNFDVVLDNLNKQKIEIIDLTVKNKEFENAINSLETEYIDFIEVIEKV